MVYTGETDMKKTSPKQMELKEQVRVYRNQFIDLLNSSKILSEKHIALIKKYRIEIRELREKLATRE